MHPRARPPTVNGLFGAAAEVQRSLATTGAPFCVIGGLALLRWAEPRQTRDVDLMVLTGFGGEGPVLDVLLTAFEARIPDARAFAERSRVVLLRASSRVGIDVSLGALPYEERVVARASDWTVADGLDLRTCSAEDLVVLKAFAGRPQDWVDVSSVVERQQARLDVGLVLEELAPLLALKEAPEDLERARALLLDDL